MGLSPWDEEQAAATVHAGRDMVETLNVIDYPTYRDNPRWAYDLHRELVKMIAMQLDIIEALMKGV